MKFTRIQKLVYAGFLFTIGLILAVSVNFLIGDVKNLYADFGAKLPLITSAILNTQPLLSIVVFTFYGLFGLYFLFSGLTQFKNELDRIVTSASFVFLIISTIVLVLVMVFAVYFPIYQISSLV